MVKLLIFFAVVAGLVLRLGRFITSVGQGPSRGRTKSAADKEIVDAEFEELG